MLTVVSVAADVGNRRLSKVWRLAYALPQFLRPAPRIAGVNDPAKEPELFTNIVPITTNVIL